jgi:glycosyltransferase involved in cell wall biosynthesis
LKNNQSILIVTECFYPEEFKINDVAISWKNKGYDVDVLTLTPTYPLGKVFPGYKNRLFYQKDMYKGINIYRVFAVTGYKESVFKKMLRYINFMILGSIIAIFIGRKYKYVFGWNAGALTDMLPVVLIKKLYGTPTMLWVQDVWPDSVYAYGFKKTKILSVLLNAFVRFIYNNVSSIAISSKGFESILKPYIKNDIKLNYAPNWAEELDMQINPVNFSKTKKIQLTFAGNIGKLQNLENIIKSYLLLSSEYQNRSQLNIIGDGSNFKNVKLCAKENSNIIFHGKKSYSEMARYYKASDFLIISLVDEPILKVTIPGKLQTYIAAKKPILGIINGDVADIILNNNLGICADPSNLSLIKKAFEICIDMSESKKLEFLENNTNLLKTIFNKDIIIDDLRIQLIEGGS